MTLSTPLISTADLESKLDDPQLRIYDVSVALSPKSDGRGYAAISGIDNWRSAHVPGAGFIDLITEFSDPNNDVPFMMPGADQFRALAQRHGISNDSEIVFYCAGTPMWATRAWWMFRAMGIDRVAVLDGGWDKWHAESRPVSSAAATYPEGELDVNPHPEMWADRDEMLDNIRAGAACTLNALAPDVYAGETNRYGRPGHIPGSHNVFYGDLLEPTSGEFLPTSQLKEQFTASGALDAERVIVYCGGGISATMDALALHLAGHTNIAIYDGSMSEWIRDESLPLVLGSEP